MDDSFKFFVDQVVGQYRELKADIKADMQEIKESMNDYKKEQGELEKRITDLENFKSYMAGVAAISFIIVEILGKVFEHYLTK